MKAGDLVLVQCQTGLYQFEGAIDTSVMIAILYVNTPCVILDFDPEWTYVLAPEGNGWALSLSFVSYSKKEIELIAERNGIDLRS